LRRGRARGISSAGAASRSKVTEKRDEVHGKACG
jgi:hypothetical protein